MRPALQQVQERQHSLAAKDAVVSASCLLAPCQCMHHSASRSCHVAGNWKTIEGEFNAIMAVVLPCRSDRSDSVCSASFLI